MGAYAIEYVSHFAKTKNECSWNAPKVQDMYEFLFFIFASHEIVKQYHMNKIDFMNINMIADLIFILHNSSINKKIIFHVTTHSSVLLVNKSTFLKAF